MSTELVQLRSVYAEPGFLLLATDSEERSVGCVGVRSLGDGGGELRRLFVDGPGRSAGLGRALSVTALEACRERGLSRVVLNTLPTMVHALELYEQLGFAPIDPYVADPTAGVLYFELNLI